MSNILLSRTFLFFSHKLTAETLPPSSVPDRVFCGSPDMTTALKGLGFFGQSMRGNSSPSCCFTAADSLHWAFDSSKSHWKIWTYRQVEILSRTVTAEGLCQFKYRVKLLFLMFSGYFLDITLVRHKEGYVLVLFTELPDVSQQLQFVHIKQAASRLQIPFN